MRSCGCIKGKPEVDDITTSQGLVKVRFRGQALRDDMMAREIVGKLV